MGRSTCCGCFAILPSFAFGFWLVVIGRIWVDIGKSNSHSKVVPTDHLCGVCADEHWKTARSAGLPVVLNFGSVVRQSRHSPDGVRCRWFGSGLGSLRGSIFSVNGAGLPYGSLWVGRARDEPGLCCSLVARGRCD